MRKIYIFTAFVIINYLKGGFELLLLLGFPFIKVKANRNAPADAANTEASSADLIPVAKVMARANIKSNTPAAIENQ